MADFVLIGAAGYVAPRHMQAIKDIGGNLVAIYDPHDSVGVVDRYFPTAMYFREFERFDRFCSMRNRQDMGIEYVSICSPNHLHDAHCRFAMRIGADAICEKPPVLTVRNWRGLVEEEEITGQYVYVVLQLRHNDHVKNTMNAIKDLPLSKRFNVAVRYHAPRGNWYRYSWKGDEEKSGGIVFNIGIHLFDILIYLFGDPSQIMLTRVNWNAIEGQIVMHRADVSFCLSTEILDSAGERSISIDGLWKIDLNENMTGLHNRVYYEIVHDGTGLIIDEVKKPIYLAERIRELYHVVNRYGQNIGWRQI